MDPVEHADWQDFMDSIETGADLVLTDPPYAISTTRPRSTGGVDRLNIDRNFGEWDLQEIDLELFCAECFRILNRGGTCIIWYDMYKVSYLYDLMKEVGFRMLRYVVWTKTNPVPINSKRAYLTGCLEMAVCGVRGKHPAFNSEYDNGVYEYPIVPGGRNRLHPTQKPIGLFEELVLKHSQEDHVVVDPFSGSGTTRLAALSNGRRFAGCDIDAGYVDIANARFEPDGLLDDDMMQ